MSRKQVIKSLCLALACASIGFTLSTHASDFNVPFVGTSGLGNFYSGWAAEGQDASIEYTNPAGMVLIPNQQLAMSFMGVTGTTVFTGNTSPPFFPFSQLQGSAGSSLNAFMPSVYYVAPLNNCLAFGFGVTTPFALSTNFSTDSILRYGATRTQLIVNDLGPSMSIRITPELSAGIGLDIDRISMTFNRMVGLPPFTPDWNSINHMTGWGYGARGGLLYQFTPNTRIGANYFSQVAFDASGYSDIFGPFVPNGEYHVNQDASVRMPPLAQLSLYHDFNCQWAVTGSVFYSDWSVLEQMTMENVAIPPAATIPVTIPFEFHDTVDYAVGAIFKPTDQWELKSGVEFLQAAPSMRYRVAADPVGSAIIVGVGAHFQQNHYLGYDIGYAHAFCEQIPIDVTSPVNTEFGHVDTATDIVGAQITWNFT